MNFLLFLFRILFGSPPHPPVTNLRTSTDDSLYFDGLTRGGLVIGRPGSGKTIWLVMQVLNYALSFRRRAIFILDASGSFTDEFIKLVYQLPPHPRNMILSRLVYDRLGDEELVIPFPFFSDDYGLTREDQVQRVKQIFEKIGNQLVTQTPVMALGITEILPQLSRLLFSIPDGIGSWQFTEIKKLLLYPGMLASACKQFGYKVPEAKWYFEKEYLGDQVSDRERELRTYTLRSLLGSIEPGPIRARVGYPRPNWTPLEAIGRGQIVLISGENIINQETVQAILFMDVFTQILAQINKRTPHDPEIEPVFLAIDEVPMLLKIPGIAEVVGRIPTLYRSRGLQMVIIFQALWQLADELREQIWSLGNNIVFGIDDFQECYQIAQQLFTYNPMAIKQTNHWQAAEHLEPDRGQYLSVANWIQHLPKRQVLLKRYLSEGEEDPYVRFVQRTTEKPDLPLPKPLPELKRDLLAKNAIPVKEALRFINQRKLPPRQQTQSKRPTISTAP